MSAIFFIFVEGGRVLLLKMQNLWRKCKKSELNVSWSEFFRKRRVGINDE
ncbi:hypothetical protein NEOCIP111885_00330 [Pseudoneobacillus rhizosphaerae]|uniref:Uncharacterized protein n=1 Tax=Pseudoneobacillus rhizosphaerae TaxID=2880968 RepID=A0A9C7L974_9BACI|nr:hypothetical protein NEOCIP111885_00330 [Pseudoneobacillus rhizosphaerae]